MQLKIKHFWALFFYWYYSKELQDKKGDNKGIRLIKKFVFKINKLTKETSSEMEQDA